MLLRYKEEVKRGNNKVVSIGFTWTYFLVLFFSSVFFSMLEFHYKLVQDAKPTLRPSTRSTRSRYEERFTFLSIMVKQYGEII